MRIALATCQEYPSLSDDDRGLITAFAEKGVQAEPFIWTDTSVNLSSFDAVIIRNCWDYWVDRSRFISWCKSIIDLNIPLLNPFEVIDWNTKKLYLADFEKQGVPIPPTEWILPSRLRSLSDVFKGNDWSEAVIKPIVSLAANMTSRISREKAAEGDKQITQILSKSMKHEGAMVQKFVPEIVDAGEMSLIFISGAFSHAVQKKACAGDFRVQFQYGGMATAVVPDPSTIRFAQDVLSIVPQSLLYARVDLVLTSKGPLLMELELTEPSLFLNYCPEAKLKLVSGAIAQISAPLRKPFGGLNR